jgi:hypothetical protein
MISGDIRAADNFSSCKSAVSFVSSSSTLALPKWRSCQRSKGVIAKTAVLPWPLACGGRANIVDCAICEGSRSRVKEGAISELGSGHQATASVPRKDGAQKHHA